MPGYGRVCASCHLLNEQGLGGQLLRLLFAHGPIDFAEGKGGLETVDEHDSIVEEVVDSDAVRRLDEAEDGWTVQRQELWVGAQALLVNVV